MAVSIDLKQGSTWRQDKNGNRATRIAHITGVTGNIDTVLLNALNDASMPNYGDAHPADSTITLQSISVRELGGGVFQAQMEYYNDTTNASGTANATLRINSSTASEESKFDINNEPMYTRYNWTGGLVNYDPFTAEVERPRTTFAAEYIDTTYPRALIDAYQGAINSDAWNGFAPETVLCTGVDADEQGNGEFRVRLSFAYEPETWQFKARASFLTLPLTAHGTDPDSELDLTTGERPFDVYPQIAFAALGIDLGGSYVELSGTASPTCTEAQIVSGGRTIILTLTGDTWAASGATFDAQRQNILDGLVSNKNEANGWNAQTFAVTSVVRTSDTVVTITLPAAATYAITQTEQITCTVPASALVTSTLPFRASQRFKVIAA